MIRKRLLKVVWPYFAWSILYVAASRPDSLIKGIGLVLTGGASGQMYYLPLYAQMVVLTPLFFRLLKSHRILLYCISPLSVSLYELSSFYGVDLSYLGKLFPMWMIFYLIGLEWDHWREIFKARINTVAIIAFFALAIQVVDGMFWYLHGSYSMAVTQLRLANTISSCTLIVLFMLTPKFLQLRLESSRTLVLLGDLSFGIYLCHMAVLMVIRKLFESIGFTDFFAALVLWLVVLLGSVIFVLISRRVLSKRFCIFLGLA